MKILEINFVGNKPLNFFIWNVEHFEIDQNVNISSFLDHYVCLLLFITKESNSTANEGKRQFNRSIIYYLNIVPIVNDSFWNSSQNFWNGKQLKKKEKKEKWSCRDSNSRQGKCSAHVKVGRYTIASRSWDIWLGSNFSLRM